MQLRRWSLIVAILALSSGIYGRSTDSPCPSITVTGPAGMISPGDAAPFSASVDGLESLIGIGYEWSVTAGTIVEGQGTSAISVKTTKDNQGVNITATARVAGLPSGCAESASEVVSVASTFVCGLPADEYGPVSWREEQMRLDGLLIRLSLNKEYTAYIHIRIGPTENETTIRKHVERIVQHLRFRERGFDPSRVIFAIENDDQSTRVTRFYIIPPKGDFPACSTNCTVLAGRDLLPKPTTRPRTRRSQP